MKLVSTVNVKEEEFAQFFEDKWSDLPNKQTLKQYGYFVEYQDQYKAYFALSPVEEDALWLKSLYIKEGVPSSLPLAIIEAAIALASDQSSNALYVYSHQQTLSSLLALMDFKKQAVPAFAEDLDLQKGTWFRTDLSRIAGKTVSSQM